MTGLRALARVAVLIAEFLSELLDDPEIRALLQYSLKAKLRASIRRDDGSGKLNNALAEGDGAGVESAFAHELLPAKPAAPSRWRSPDPPAP